MPCCIRLQLQPFEIGRFSLVWDRRECACHSPRAKRPTCHHRWWSESPSLRQFIYHCQSSAALWLSACVFRSVISSRYIAIASVVVVDLTLSTQTFDYVNAVITPVVELWRLRVQKRLSGWLIATTTLFEILLFGKGKWSGSRSSTSSGTVKMNSSTHHHWLVWIILFLSYCPGKWLLIVFPIT